MFFSRPAGEKYFTRDSVDDYDFQIGDLINDNDWHELALKDVTSKKPALVLFALNVITTTLSDVAWFRQKGSVGKNQELSVRVEVTGTGHIQSFAIAPDKNGIIEYNLLTGDWTLFDMSIYGGFK